MKAIALLQNPDTHGRIVTMHSPAKREDSLLQQIADTGKLILPDANGFVCLRFDDIIYLRAQSNYTEIYLNEKKLLFSKTLKSIELQLPQRMFCRVHKSFLVNVGYIRSYIGTSDDSHLVLENDICIPVSRSGRAMLR